MPDHAFKPKKHSPLTDLATPAAGIELEQRPYVGKLNLRGDPRDEAFVDTVKRTLGVSLPLAPNTAAMDSECTTFWLGPDEWLIHTAEDAQVEAAAALKAALAGRHFAVTDVSDYYLIIRMRGDRAREVLSKGTPFDVHPAAFGTGACAQTCYGHATILLHCVDAAPTFDIQVRWSFAEYLWSYLVDGAREYG